MIRVDEFPKYEINGIRYAKGRTMPFGAELIGNNTVNFSIYSKDATGCELVLYHLGEDEPFLVFPFPEEFRIGSVFSVMFFDLDWENIEYGYRFDGPSDFVNGYRFDKTQTVLDPYAKLVSGREVFHTRTYPKGSFEHRGRIIREDFIWEDDKPLEIPFKDLVIYELHVRGFTMDPSSNVKRNGTYAGIIEKIPYLKELGINCIELMPIFEFEEFLPGDHDDFCNYWGYVTYNYFSPKAGYASSGPVGLAADELKNLIKQLHKNGIEVILDIVFNHTGEYDDYISFRGVDNRTYYVMNDDGTYANFTGCGNTVNCNNPIVRNFIIDSLRYWVSTYHVDGFRVDEAPIFARGEDGKPMISPPLVDSLVNDPVLSRTKFISEGWDGDGFFTIGSFPKGWADWNPRSRDTIKRFVKSMAEAGPELLLSIEGSPDMFPTGSPASSVNYITCHDGFTLYDTVAYSRAYNEKNPFTSGMDHIDNCSWNCGAEGETDDPEINALRVRQMKNQIGLLLLSRGVPMLLSGDEFANTQYGNNNAFALDSEVSWLQWNRLEQYQDLFEYYKTLIAFRKAHPVLRKDTFFSGYNSSGYPELSWHGEKAWNLDSSNPFLTFAFLYAEPAADFKTDRDYFIYCAVNAHWEEHTMELPIIPEGMEWHIVAYTGDTSNQSTGEVCREKIRLMPRSLMLLLGY